VAPRHHTPQQPTPTPPQTTTHNKGITTHIEIIQRDTTLIIEHTTYTNNTTYTKKHATINLLDPEFLEKVHQAVEK
jgi:hypothetical protein